MRTFDRFNKMMEEMFGTTDGFLGIWTPNVDVKETKYDLTFIAELRASTRRMSKSNLLETC